MSKPKTPKAEKKPESKLDKLAVSLLSDTKVVKEVKEPLIALSQIDLTTQVSFPVFKVAKK